jgi:ribonuclease G
MIRNLSGIIVIEFIDINNTENKKKIMQAIKEGLRTNKKKTVIYPFTNLFGTDSKKKKREVYI